MKYKIVKSNWWWCRTFHKWLYNFWLDDTMSAVIDTFKHLGLFVWAILKLLFQVFIILPIEIIARPFCDIFEYRYYEEVTDGQVA